MMKRLAHGTKIGRFEVQDEVGRGGMGVVYRCFDPVLKRPIALKLLASHLGHDTTALARFQREATLVASLKHAHIAIVYDFGEYEGQPYIALEWIEGQTLKMLLQEPKPLSLERCLHFFDQLASALDYAHQRGVIHRDLKPANIIIGPDDLVTIVDFGIAWLDAEPSITTTGSIVGTPLYMSPEQIQGKTLDRRSDLYSLAVILYQMLSGEVPFDSDTPAALFQQLIHAPPPPISEHNPTLPPAIEATLNKALAKNPDNRFSDGASMGRALRGIDAVPATPSSSLAQQGKKQRGLRLSSSLLVGGILFSLIVVVVMLYNPFQFDNNDNENEASSLPLPTEVVLVNDQEQASSTNEEAEESLTVISEKEFDEEETFFWPMAGGDASQSRFIDLPLPQFVPEAELFFEAESIGGLVGALNHVVVGQGLELVLLNGQNGEEIQDPLLLGAEITATPLLLVDEEDSVIVVPAQEGQLYAFELATGRFKWHVGAEELLGSLPNGVMIDYNESLYAATDEGHVYRLEQFSKEMIWHLDLSDQERFIQPPSVTNVALFLASEAQALLAIDLAMKDIAWRTETIGTPLTAPIAIEEWGVVIVGTDEGVVQAFSMISGAEVWSYDAGSEVFGLAVDWERVYLVTANQQLIVLSKEDEEVIGQIIFDQPIVDAPISTSNGVIVATEAGEIHIISADEENEASGELEVGVIQTLNVERRILQSPIPLGNWLFVQTNEGIYRFSAQEESE